MLTESDFQEQRRSRALNAWKRAMWDAGCPLPTQLADGRAVCFCGAAIDDDNTDAHIYTAHIEIAE